MNQNNLSVRMWRETDFDNIVDYFLNADENSLKGMGADQTKLPKKAEWLKLFADDFTQNFENKKLFYVIWLLNNKAVGHSNLNRIVFGEEANMHLHLWTNDRRQKGLGTEFIKKSLPYYFDNFKLKRLYCEPYSLNPAPNKTLKRSGFDFVEQYETVPGAINFYQTVNKWCLTYEKYKLQVKT